MCPLGSKIVDGSVAELMLHLANNRYIRVYLYDIDQAVYFGDGVFIKDNRPGSIRLGEVLGSMGGGKSLVSHSYPVKKNTWYVVTTNAKDNAYTVTVGGQKIIEYVDNKRELSSEGTIGLLTNGHAQFDDILVKSNVHITSP